ncbi:MAG: TrbI/VirB10 family protein [Pseudomonadota bacterium]
MTETNSDPSAGPAPKLDQSHLALRARPASVTRINRKVLVGLIGIGGLALFAATLFALDPPRLGESGAGRELYNTDRVPTAEGLQALPRDYGELEPPQLGPPLPGDLGPGMVEAERQAGIDEPLPPTLPSTGFRPDPEEEAARQERLRLARELEEALTSRVFFSIDGGGLADDQAGAIDGSSLAGLLPVELAALSGPPSLAVNDADSDGIASAGISIPGQPADSGGPNPNALQDPVSPYQVMAGTVIAASLITGLNSDLPGQVIAQVTEHVYDSISGRHLLIPQGTRLLGVYDSDIGFAQERALVVWRRLILPNGASILLDDMAAVDRLGQAGLADRVDHHTGRLLFGVALATLLGVSAELAAGDEDDGLIAAGRDSAFESTNDIGHEIAQRNLDVPPTITVRPGHPVQVIVTRDLTLRPYRG